MKEKYKTSERVRLAMNKYLKSDKGKATRKAWVDANKEDMSDYHKKYMKKKREASLANKICVRCFKNPIVKGHVQCEGCLKPRGKNYDI